MSEEKRTAPRKKKNVLFVINFVKSFIFFSFQFLVFRIFFYYRSRAHQVDYLMGEV